MLLAVGGGVCVCLFVIVGVYFLFDFRCSCAGPQEAVLLLCGCGLAFLFGVCLVFVWCLARYFFLSLRFALFF